MVRASIWKDTYYTANVSSLEYRIELDNTVIFTGRAYARPNESVVKININRICENYLKQDIDTILTGATTQNNADALHRFVLKNKNGNILETYDFVYDWSYGENWTGGATTIISQPINGHYVDGMLKLVSTVADSGVGTQSNSSAYNKEVCADYALYFVTAKGGWSSFVFEGSVTKKDAITSYSASRYADNTTYDFEVSKYAEDITRTYTAKTGWLNDDESEAFAQNVPSTPKAYLHNLAEGTITPVVITDTAVDYQKFKTNNRKFAQYTVNIKESKVKHRR